MPAQETPMIQYLNPEYQFLKKERKVVDLEQYNEVNKLS